MVVCVDHLVGAAEIGEMLGGVSRQRVYQVVSRRDFPAPVIELAMGKVWNREDVQRWIDEHRGPANRQE